MLQAKLDYFINTINSGKAEISPEPIIFLYSLDHINDCLRLIEAFNRSDRRCKVIALDYETESRLRSLKNETNIRFVVTGISEYKDWKNVESDADIKAVELAGAWYKNGRNDYTLCDGMSMGDLYHRLMAYYFMDIIRTVEEMKAVIDKENPGDIIFLEGTCDKTDGSFLTSGMNCHGEIAAAIKTQENGRYRLHRLNIGTGSCQKNEHKHNFNLSKNAKSVMCVLFGLYRTIVNIGMKYTDSIMIRYYSYTEKTLIEALLKKPGVRVVLSTASADAMKHFFFRRNFFCIPVKKNPANTYGVSSVDRMDMFIKFENEKDNHLKYGDLEIWPIIREKIKYLFTEGFDKALSDINFINSAIKKFSITKMMLDTDAGFEGRKYAFAARKSGVISFVVQHGAAAIDRRSDICFLPFRADKFFAWDTITKEWLVDNGVAEAAVNVCGSLKAEYMKNKVSAPGFIKNMRKKVYRDLNIDSRARTMLFVSQSVGEKLFPNVHVDLQENVEYIKALSRVADLLKDTVLIVKLHPSDPHILFIVEHLKEEGCNQGNIRIVKDCPVDNLIMASDVLISHFSSTIFSALAINVPVVSVNFRKLPFCAMATFDSGDFMYKARDEKELRDAVNFLINDREVRQEYVAKGRAFMKKHFPDGEIGNICSSIFSKSALRN